MNVAKIAAIACHTTPGLTLGEAPRCAALIPCSFVDFRCSGRSITLFAAPGNRPDSPRSLCHAWRKPARAGAGPEKFPAPGNCPRRGARCRSVLLVEPDRRKVLVHVMARADLPAFDIGPVRHDALPPQQVN